MDYVVSLIVITFLSALTWIFVDIVYMSLSNDYDTLLERIVRKWNERKTVKRVETVEEPKLLPRPNPLNMFEEKVFNDWLEAKDNRTLDDFCLYETENEHRARKQREHYEWEHEILTNPHYYSKKSAPDYTPDSKYFETQSVANRMYPSLIEQRNITMEDLYTEPYKSIEEELINTKRQIEDSFAAIFEDTEKL